MFIMMAKAETHKNRSNPSGGNLPTGKKGKGKGVNPIKKRNERSRSIAKNKA